MSSAEVIRRRAGRVVLLDEHDRILMLQGFDPTRGDPPWWFTPGGGVEGDESTKDAARRELREETGLDFPDLIGPIWCRSTEFDFYGAHYEQYEEFFLARVAAHELVDDAWTELERTTVIGHRWLSVEQLQELEGKLFPRMLVAQVGNLVSEGVPAEMIEIE